MGGIYENYNAEKGVPILYDPVTDVTRAVVFDRCVSIHENCHSHLFTPAPFGALYSSRGAVGAICPLHSDVK